MLSEELPEGTHPSRPLSLLQLFSTPPEPGNGAGAKAEMEVLAGDVGITTAS